MANKTPANPKIADIVCPLGGCAAEVRQIKPSATSLRKNRYAGAKYIVCPVHGKIGGDGKPAMNDYIEQNAVTVQPTQAPAPAQASAPAPADPPAADPPPADRAAGGWGFFK
jgi:nucleoid-associated protein YgaU